MGVSVLLGLATLWVMRIGALSVPTIGTLVFLMFMGCGIGGSVGAYAVEHWRSYRWQGPVVAVIAFAIVLSAGLSDLRPEDLRSSINPLMKWLLAGAIPAGAVAYLTGYLADKLSEYQNVAEAVGLNEQRTGAEQEISDDAV